jgi:hypothetical protein
MKAVPGFCALCRLVSGLSIFPALQLSLLPTSFGLVLTGAFCFFFPGASETLLACKEAKWDGSFMTQWGIPMAPRTGLLFLGLKSQAGQLPACLTPSFPSTSTREAISSHFCKDKQALNEWKQPTASIPHNFHGCCHACPLYCFWTEKKCDLGVQS